MNTQTIANAKLLEENSSLKRRIRELERTESERVRKEKIRQKFQFSIEQAPDAVFWMDKTGRFEYGNENACRSLGYTREELLSLYLWEIDPFYSRERLAADWAGYQKGGDVNLLPLETWHRRKDGVLLPVEILARHYWFDKTEFLVAFVRDITARKQTDESVKQLSRRNEEALRVARMGRWEFDVTTGIFLFNDQYYALHGITAAEVGGYQMTAGAFAARFVHPDDAHQVRDTIQTMIESEDPDFEHQIEARILRADGEARWVAVWCRGQKDGQGRTIRLYGVNQDVTELKRAEQEAAILAEIGRLISSTLNIDEVYERFAAETKKLIPFDSLTINLYNSQENSHRVAYVSGVDISGRRQGDALLLTGSLSEAVILARTGLCVQSADIDEVVGRFPRLFPIFQAGLRSIICVPLVYRDEVIGVLHFRSKKPNAYTNQDLCLAEKIGIQIAGAIANAQLFNVFSKTEKSLRESNELFSLFMQHSPINSFIKEVTPTRSRVLQASDNFRQKVGIPGCEMVGKSMAELFPPEFAAKINADDRAVICSGDVLRIDEELNGRSYTTIKFPIVQGDKTLVAGYSIDITESKRVEAEKRSLEERLQRAKKMEALGQLAGGVAHDLNNFLGVLSGYSELLLREIPEGHRSRRHVEKILQSTEKGAAIIDDLLTLARRGVTVLDVVRLDSVVSGFLRTPVFEKIKNYHPQVTFRTECDKNIQSIKGSPVHLEKTLMNLVSNAAEAISGKGEVTIRTESCYLDKPVRGYDEIKEGNYAVMVVSDTGAGISPENLDKVFEPFYTKKTMGRSGTGLGLTIVWGTVKDHNGYIDVQTEVGGGTTFMLYFPVTREEPIARQQKEPVEHYMGKGESVLVVDDMAEQRDVAAGLLALLGYKVHAVSSGEEAVEYLAGNRADILVLDMIMAPGIDGLETYKRILKISPKQKAVLVSGFSETNRVREAQRLGAGAYVKKPYLMEKIGVAIRDELLKVTVSNAQA